GVSSVGRGDVDGIGAFEQLIEACSGPVAAPGWIDIVDGGNLGARIASEVRHVQTGGVPGSRDSNAKLHRMASSVSVSNRWIFSGGMRNQNGSPELRRTPAGARKMKSGSPVSGTPGSLARISFAFPMSSATHTRADIQSGWDTGENSMSSGR